LLTDRIESIITDNESAEIINESQSLIKNNPQIWTKSELPSSHASSIDNMQYGRKSNALKEFYSPIEKKNKQSAF
jgi:hypothetical protein